MKFLVEKIIDEASYVEDTIDEASYVEDTKKLIIDLSETLIESAHIADQISLNFEALGIHSADLDKYIINDLANMGDLDDTEAFGLNCAKLYKRLEKFEKQN